MLSPDCEFELLSHHFIFVCHSDFNCSILLVDYDFKIRWVYKGLTVNTLKLKPSEWTVLFTFYLTKPGDGESLDSTQLLSPEEEGAIWLNHFNLLASANNVAKGNVDGLAE